MSVPAVSVPASHDYNYRWVQLQGSDMQVMSNIGSRINPDFETGRRWTPSQKSRAFAITLVALSAIGTAAAFMAGAIATSAIGFVAIPLAVVGGFSIWFLATRKPDLDSPRDRDVVTRKIAALRPHEIIQITTRDFTLDKIVGYALLDRITGPNTSQHIGGPRANFYSQFAQLAKAFKSINNQHDAQVVDIDTQFNEAIRDARQWRNAQETIINQRNMIASQAHTIASNRRVRVENANSRRSFGTRVPYSVAGRDAGSRSSAGFASAMEGIAAVANVAVHVHGHLTMQEVNRTYHDAIGPAVQWRHTQLAKANTEHSRAIVTLDVENQYTAILRQFHETMARNDGYRKEDHSVSTDLPPPSFSQSHNSHPATPPPPYQAPSAPSASAPPPPSDVAPSHPDDLS